ncbi:MAG: retropepsin-like aspartic protease [Methylomonas sp.]|jgi:aspartyl protease family protein
MRYDHNNRRPHAAWAPAFLMPVVTLAALWWAADEFLPARQTPTVITIMQTAAASLIDAEDRNSAVNADGEVVLKADRLGHFRGKLQINDVSLPFMIDTGATKTSIPYEMAIAAGLPFGKSIKTMTAGGQVVDQLTRIKSLRLGNVEITNLDANINQHLAEVLIGMNTLKLFNMTQSDGTLRLSANKPAPAATVLNATPAGETPADIMEPEQLVKKPLALKKTVSCDSNKVCRTIYSDH